jgi:hypothetical protein
MNTIDVHKSKYFDQIVVVEDITPRQAAYILRHVAKRDVVYVSTPKNGEQTILGITRDSARRIGLARRGEKYALLLGAEMSESQWFWDELHLSAMVDKANFKNAASSLTTEDHGILEMPEAVGYCNWYGDETVPKLAHEYTDEWLKLFDLAAWADFAAKEAAMAVSAARVAAELITGFSENVAEHLLPYTDLSLPELRLLAIREMVIRCIRTPHPRGTALDEKSGDNFLYPDEGSEFEL